MAANIGTAISGWSTTAGSNQPDSTDLASTLREDLQAIQAAVRYLRTAGTIASASTTDMATKSEEILSVSGTTTITALGTVSAGMIKVLVFEGALVLTHNGTSLILPTGANITTAAGDVAVMLSLGSGNWRCIGYEKASGQPVNTAVSVASVGTSGAVTAGNGLTVTTGNLAVSAGTITASGNITSSAGIVNGTKNSQTSYGTAGLQSTSASGNAGIGLHCTTASAAYIEHARSGSGITVKDSVGATANIVGKELFATPGSGNAQFTATNPSANVAYFGMETGGSAYISSTAADPVYVAVSSTAQFYVGTTGTYPSTNGTKELGLSTNRWAVVYAANGTINTSDKREKDHIATVEEVGGIIDALKPVRFSWKQDGRVDIGFYAQDVAPLVPEAVRAPKDENELWGFQPDRLIPLLVAEIQSLRARMAMLENK